MNILIDSYDSIPYGQAMERQMELHRQVLEGKLEGAIMVLQHPPVLSLGKYADESNLLKSRDFLLQHGIEVYETDRGGEVTAHMPGQLVVYPILPVRALGLGPKSLVDKVLLGSVIKTMSEYGIEGRLDHDNPGVWVGNHKLSAVGIRVSQRVSTHGISFNINNSLDIYRWIVPCGIREKGVSTMAQELGRELDFQELKLKLMKHIFTALDIDLGHLELL